MGSPPSRGKYERFTAEPLPERYRAPVQNASYGMSAERIAAVCGVDVATARRWKSGRSRIPHAAAALLLGDLGAFGNHWSGWRVAGDALVSPDGWKINRNHALSVPLMEAQIKQRDAKIAALEEHIAYLMSVQALEDQPTAGSLPAEVG